MGKVPATLVDRMLRLRLVAVASMVQLVPLDCDGDSGAVGDSLTPMISIRSYNRTAAIHADHSGTFQVAKDLCSDLYFPTSSVDIGERTRPTVTVHGDNQVLYITNTKHRARLFSLPKYTNTRNNMNLKPAMKPGETTGVHKLQNVCRPFAKISIDLLSRRR